MIVIHIIHTGKGSLASCITNPSMTWVKMRGRTLAVWRSIKLGAALVIVLRTFTADDLCTLLSVHDQSATQDEYSEPADLRADTSETGLVDGGSEDFIPSSSATVWLADSFSLATLSTGHASTDSSGVCVDAAAMTTVDVDAGRADVTTGCGNDACCRGDTSIHIQQNNKY